MIVFCMCKVRVPVGKIIFELPAGMIDDEKGDVIGTAVREVRFTVMVNFLA